MQIPIETQITNQTQGKGKHCFYRGAYTMSTTPPFDFSRFHSFALVPNNPWERVDPCKKTRMSDSPLTALLNVGCPKTKRVAFWERLRASAGEVVQTVPGVDIVLAGDSNLWVPGLVHACSERAADRACLNVLNVLLETFELAICNPPGKSTHSRGAALDLVIASPRVISN